VEAAQMTAAGKLERQRQRIRQLIEADPVRSATSIANEIGCSTHTVIRQRELHMQMHTADCTVNGTARAAHAGSANLMPPAERGNGRALSHGGYSAARRAPLEDEHRERLRQLYPAEADDLVNLQAKRCALVDLYSSWLLEHGPVRGKGDVAPAARELRLLLDSAERAGAAMEARSAARAVGAGVQTLADIAAEYQDGAGEPAPAEVIE
jgi:hypothetical protein